MFLRILGFVFRQPLGRELLQIDKRGCMATDWHIIDRGTIIGVSPHDLNGNTLRQDNFYIVKRGDGSLFTAIVSRCNHQPDREASRFAGEDLTGKIYEGL